MQSLLRRDRHRSRRQRAYDLTGSYGVNVFGYDFYKEAIARRRGGARELGPVLGPYHPAIVDNVRRLKEISGLDEVSFHMSGTEAVMQAVRLARYHTGRSHLVRFCGAYHGWWGDVQPGIGNPAPAHETYTLERNVGADAARAAHAPRHRLRAGQSAAGAASERAGAGDSSLVDSARARAFRQGRLYAVAEGAARGLHRARHRADLRRGVRRLPPRARRRAGIFRRAAPTSSPTARLSAAACRSACVCGRKRIDEALSRRSPGRHLLCPRHVQFPSLRHARDATSSCTGCKTRDRRRCTAISIAIWDERAQQLNARFAAGSLPVEVANMSSIWTVCYTEPSRYNWMLQYYLRAEGLALELDRDRPSDLQPQLHRGRLRRGGGPLRRRREGHAATTAGGAHPAGLTNKAIRRGVLKEMIRHRFLG